jgi:hypothetical protein
MKTRPVSLPSTFLALAAAVSVAVPAPLSACCMVPRDYDVAISQSGQKAILFHSGDREELILRIHYQIQAKKEGAKMPDHFAWIITVPNEPDHYEIADPKIFDAAWDWARPLVKKPEPRSFGLNADSAMPMAAGGVVLSEAVEVGPYKIQPVRAVGANALAALNEWLVANDFPAEDPGHMAYFVDHNFTFLCVKVQPGADEATVPSSAELPPIQLSFKSEEPYYPLRFSSRQGVFDLSLIVLTKKKLNYKKSSSALGKINFARGTYKENVTVDPAKFPDLLAKAFAKTTFKDEKDTQWNLNVLRTKNVNQGNAIASWSEDVFFTTQKGFFGMAGGCETEALAASSAP